MRWPGHAGIEKEIDWKDDFYIQVSYFSSLRSLHFVNTYGNKDDISTHRVPAINADVSHGNWI